jgi:glycosyltransferase involved in cell wall biosynthesis
MAAGLPIVASDMPAHSGFLQHGHTGWLCEPSADLAPAFEALEEQDRNLEMGAAARSWVAREVGTWDDCADRFANSYRTLLE